MSKAHSHEHAPDPEADPAKPHDDDVIVVPKGSSRARFLMTALLAVLILTTFTVSGEVLEVLTGKGSSRAFMTWNHPRQGAKTLDGSDFYFVKRNLSKVYSLLQGRNQRDVKDEDTALHVINDELAQDAGVHVTDGELQKLILRHFGNADTYRQALSSYKMSAKEFELTVRALMRVNRYEVLLAAGFSAVDPAEVEGQWKREHPQYSLDYVELPVERVMDEARAQAPADPELEKWYQDLSEVLKAPFREVAESTRSAEVAFYPLDGTGNATVLLARHPRPESEDREQVARNYYESYKSLLFVKPGVAPGSPPGPDDFRPFDEVREGCLRDGTALQSLIEWHATLRQREDQGEKLLLSTEAVSLGLGFRQETQLHARGKWMQIAMPWSGTEMVDALFAQAVPERLVPDVIVDPKSILVARVLGLQDSRTPAFAEIPGKVRDLWVSRKAGELALAKLEALAAKLPTEPDALDPAATVTVEPDAEKFLAAVKEAGVEVKTLAGLDPRAKPRADARTPLDMFLRRTAIRYGSKVGTVCKPELATDGSAAWIARISAQGDGDAARMSASDVQSLTEQASRQARFDFVTSTFQSIEFMKERYGLQMEIWKVEAESPKPEVQEPEKP